MRRQLGPIALGMVLALVLAMGCWGGPAAARAGDEATVSGLITFENGPIDAEVRFQQVTIDPDGTVHDNGQLGIGTATYTDSYGVYSISLPRGARYTMSVNPGFGERTYLGGSRSIDHAQTFVLVTDLADVDLELDLFADTNGDVTGTVTAPSGEPVAGVRVRLWVLEDAFAPPRLWATRSEVTTDSDGHFRLRQVDAGYYTLFFDTDQAGLPYHRTWLGGYSQPALLTDPGVIDREVAEVDFATDLVLSNAPAAAGRAKTHYEVDLVDVTGYSWAGGQWTEFGHAVAASDGRWLMDLPVGGATVTFRFAQRGDITHFVGGGRVLPTWPSSANSLQAVAGHDLAVPDTVIESTYDYPTAAHATEAFEYDCLADDTLEPADDAVGAVDLPFPVRLGGQDYTTAYVSTNGILTLGAPLDDQTPRELASVSSPIIAPFWADADTRALGTGRVQWNRSYRAGLAGMCFTWFRLGASSQHDDRLDTFQVFLRTPEGEPGRSPGDVDIIFNYDGIEWDRADGATTSAVAGWSAGPGSGYSRVQMPGSLVAGALLDDGPQALTLGSRPSPRLNDLPGRYVWQVHDDVVQPVVQPVTPPVTPPTAPPIAPGVDDTRQPTIVATDVTAARVSTTTTLRLREPTDRRRRARVTVLVTGAAGGGTVSILERGRVLVSTVLQAGQQGAALRLPHRAAGRHRLTATYSGDVVGSASRSRPVVLIVPPRR